MGSCQPLVAFPFGLFFVIPFLTYFMHIINKINKSFCCHDISLVLLMNNIALGHFIPLATMSYTSLTHTASADLANHISHCSEDSRMLPQFDNFLMIKG